MVNVKNKKLLAECFEALEQGKTSEAIRKLQYVMTLSAKQEHSLLESEDPTVDMPGLGDDLSTEIASSEESGDNSEQVMIAIDELEEKYPEELPEEVAGRFDELRNAVDDFRLTEGEEADSTDALVVLEDLKNDFEVVDGMSDEVVDLFNEIGGTLSGEEETDEDDAEEGTETEEENPMSEADGEEDPLAPTKDETSVPDEDVTTGSSEGEEQEEQDEDDIIFDATMDAEKILANLEKLTAIQEKEKGKEGGEETSEPENLKPFTEEGKKVEEGFEKVRLERNKLRDEEAGVKKQGMKFPKNDIFKDKAELGIAKTDSKGSEGPKPKTDKLTEPSDLPAKKWTKIAKPENSPKKGDSLINGKK